MKTNLQNALQNMAPDLAPEREPAFTAAVMTRIRARARRRRILTAVAVALIAMAVLALAGIVLYRALATVAMPAFSAPVIVPVALIAAACTAMMLAYDSILNRLLSRHTDKSPSGD